MLAERLQLESPESPAQTAWPLTAWPPARSSNFFRARRAPPSVRYEPLRLIFGPGSVATSGLRRLKRRESLAGAAGERDDRLALVEVERLA
jgi:hypothetical protein